VILEANNFLLRGLRAREFIQVAIESSLLPHPHVKNVGCNLSEKLRPEDGLARKDFERGLSCFEDEQISMGPGGGGVLFS